VPNLAAAALDSAMGISPLQRLTNVAREIGKDLRQL
jgi:hypothetical protein